MRHQFQSGVCVVIFCLCLLSDLSAQNITEKNWMFGNSPQYLVFDKSGRDAVLEDDQAVPFGTGGSAVINDQYTGDLLFYTDGQRVYDASHTMLPGVFGSPLSGNTTFNQAALACPVPGNLDQYYIFTNSDTAVNYSIVDASLQGNGSAMFPLGEITGTKNRSIGLTNQSEGMILIEAADGFSYWMITQNRISFEFNITHITDSGFFKTDTLIFTGVLPGFEANQFAYNADSLELAVAPKTPNRNVLILNFDNTDGSMSFDRNVRNSGTTDEIYDVEWSSDGTKLYFSVLGNVSNMGGVYQVNYADTVDTDPYLVLDFLPYKFHRSYGLRRGIDNRIYHLFQMNAADPFTVGRIDQANDVGFLVNYDSAAFTEDFAGTQFPSFAPPQLPVFVEVTFQTLYECYGNTTQFFPIAEPEPNNYLWLFGDGTGSVAAAPLKEYDAPGTYPVTLLAELNGRIGRADLSVNIIQIDTAYLGMDTTICQGSGYNLDPGLSGGLYSYVWNTGATTATIPVDADTTRSYWVNVTDLNTGCTTYDDIVVTVYLSEPQPPSSQWYFGEKAALDFSSGAPQAIFDDNLMYSPEGCASISDINGDLLFYTNGSTVWNKEHDVMVNGTLLGGDSTAAQSALIIPFADDNTLFYIFTTEEVYGDDVYSLKYSIVDIKQDTARGAVMKKGISLVRKSSERVTASGFDSPILLTHEFGNNNFRAYSITGSGISAASHSSIGEPHQKENAANQSGYMKFSPLGTDLSVLIPGDPNYLEIFDFNIQNGAITTPRLIDLQEPAPAQAYGLEYSSTGQKIYVSINELPVSKVLQYDLDSLYSNDAATHIEASKFPVPGVTLPDYGALQLGPDGAIYFAIDNSITVGSISGSTSDNPTINEAAETIDNDGTRLSRKGLPNFVQSGGVGTQASASASIACVGQETVFSGAGLDPNQQVETFLWDFGDGTTSGLRTSPDTTHVYTAPISTVATLTINGCSGDTIIVFNVPIQAFNIPEEPLVPTDTALCGGTVTLSIWHEDDPTLNFYWSTGQTTRTVTFTEPGIVDAAITNNDGCSSDTVRVFIGDGGTAIDLGPNLLLCQNDPRPLLDANNIGPDFLWRRDSVIIGDQRVQEVQTSIAGTFTYSVAVTNEFTGCTARDSITVTILPEPDFEQANAIPPDCGEANGSFEIQFNAAGSYSYEITGPVNAGPFTFDGPGTTPPLPNLEAGTYIVTATNTTTECRNVEVMLLEDDAPFEMEAISQNGCFRSGDIRVILRNFIGTRVDINVLNAEGETVYSEQNRTASNVRIQDLDTGLYYVSARQVVEPQCLQTDTVHLKLDLKCYRTVAAPNAFTPGDRNGLNDQFRAFPSDFINKFEIFIYNRWGQIVFNSKDKNFRWDGTFQNQNAPPGTYAYKMVFTSTLEPGLGDIIQYGSVTLIR